MTDQTWSDPTASVLGDAPASAGAWDPAPPPVPGPPTAHVPPVAPAYEPPAPVEPDPAPVLPWAAHDTSVGQGNEDPAGWYTPGPPTAWTPGPPTATPPAWSTPQRPAGAGARRAGRLNLLVAALCVVGLVATAWVLGSREDRLQRVGVSVAAVVTSVDGGSDVITLTYALDGRTFTADGIPDNDYRTGAEVRMRVDPGDPTSAVLAQESFYPPTAFFVMVGFLVGAVVTAVLAVILLLVAGAQRRRARRTQNFGRVLPA